MHKNSILFIITDFGSFNNFLSELCFSLIKKHDFKISVICSSDKVIDFENKFDFESIGIHFHFVEIPRGYNILKQINASKQINSIIEIEQPDIIHAHFTTAIFTTLLLKKFKTKIWGTFHGLGFPVSKGLKKIMYIIMEYFCFSRLEKIIVLNEIDFINVPKSFRSRLIKNTCLGLGCDIQKFDKKNFSADMKSLLKKELKIDQQFILAFTGRFVYFKGFDIVAKLFIELSKKHNGLFKLILIGGLDKIHITGLKKEEEKLFFNHPDVISIGFTKEVNKYLAIVDLFIFPSKKEGIPISITEALVMGIPVVTFNSRGCNELVKDGYNGILIDENLHESEEINLFVKAIERLSDDKELYNMFRINALHDRENLSRENYINENINWYHHVLC